jgi:hypothetical protein
MLGGCGIIPRKSGVEIVSTPPTKVYIDEKEAGMTPYKNNSLVPGEIDLRLVAPEGVEWKKKIKMFNGVNTVVNWKLSDTESENGGYILYLEKTGDKNKAGLLVNASPDQSVVYIDGEIKGFTPMRLDSIGEGDREISVSFPGRKSTNIIVKALNGFLLVLDTTLPEEEPLATPTQEPVAQPSLISSGQKIMIKETETGWLRVRDLPGNTATEIDRVKPLSIYTMLSENNGWFQIDLGNGESGWVSTKYAEKVE